MSLDGVTPLTDAQLRASAVSVSAASLPLPADAATSAKQDTLLTELQLKADLTETQPVSLATVPSHAVTNAGTFAVQESGAALTALQLLDNAISGSEMQVDVVAPLPVGTNAIGKLAANSGVDIGDVDITSIVPGTGATNLGKAEDAAHTTGDVGVMALAVSNEANTARAADGDYLPIATDTEGNQRIVGNRDHDAIDAGEVVKIGGVAVAGGASPTPVASADRVRWIFNAHGVPYVIGGHPNLITREYDLGTGGSTDLNLAAAAVAADERIYVTRFEATSDNANTGNVAVRAGFGASTVPAASASGVSGMIGSHPGVAPGSGLLEGNGAGVIAIGGLGEEPRCTSTAASANVHILISYYLVDETP